MGLVPQSVLTSTHDFKVILRCEFYDDHDNDRFFPVASKLAQFSSIYLMICFLACIMTLNALQDVNSYN